MKRCDDFRELFVCVISYTLPKTNSSPLKIGKLPKGNEKVFQPSIFRGYVMLVSGSTGRFFFGWFLNEPSSPKRWVFFYSLRPRWMTCRVYLASHHRAVSTSKEQWNEVRRFDLKINSWFESWCTKIITIPNEKKPGCLGYIGDYTTQLYGDYVPCPIVNTYINSSIGSEEWNIGGSSVDCPSWSSPGWYPKLPPAVIFLCEVWGVGTKVCCEMCGRVGEWKCISLVMWLEMHLQVCFFFRRGSCSCSVIRYSPW